MPQTRKKIKRAENSVRGKKENLVQAGKPMPRVMRGDRVKLERVSGAQKPRKIIKIRYDKHCGF